MVFIRKFLPLGVYAVLGLGMLGLACSNGSEPECASDADCLDDETCVNGVCEFGVVECTVNTDCPSGDTCVDGFCQGS